MIKPKFLFHGSPKKIKGGFLVPRQPHDLENCKENLKKGVYASNLKGKAISMAIISSKGVRSSSLNFKKRKKAIVYEGWPKQKYFYLYILPSENFSKSNISSSQWVSSKKVKPIKTKKLKVKDYLHLIRKATQKEVEKVYKKYRLKSG